jgi:large subunit ribosomal protein L13
MHKTFNLKSAEVDRQWVVIDATEAPLGRVATKAAQRLIGKYKPTYTAHIDNGDYVIIVNAEKLIVTGTKETTKQYHRHSGFPGGITSKSLKDLRQSDPAKILTAAIKGMLPKNKLLAERLKRLKIYTGAQHGHEAQKPTQIGVN